MNLRPWTFGSEPAITVVDVGDVRAEELTETMVDALLSEGRKLQMETAMVPVRNRLRVLHQLGEIWSVRCRDGELDTVRSALKQATGYSDDNIEMEMALVSKALSAEALYENVDVSLPGGADSLDSFVPFGRSGEVRSLPVGPVVILASGNSIIPAVIPTAISLALGNFTLLKPSISNYNALIQIFSPLRELAPRDPAAELMARSLVISYFSHDSPRLKHLLEEGDVGAVNYWGGEAGRSRIMSSAQMNPAHPRCFSNGPLTGMAIISAEGAGPTTAIGLAHNMVLYEQQLCSSPTIGAFIGTAQEAIAFSQRAAEELDRFGSLNLVPNDDDLMFLRSSSLRVMELAGSTVLQSKNGYNAWAIAISESGSNLDLALTSFPGFGVHARRRFLELVVVKDLQGASDLIASLPSMISFRGVEKVQTVGTALDDAQMLEAKSVLPPLGIYRLVPIETMYLRDAAEPYDGQPLAALFSYSLYHHSGEKGQ